MSDNRIVAKIRSEVGVDTLGSAREMEVKPAVATVLPSASITSAVVIQRSPTS